MPCRAAVLALILAAPAVAQQEPLGRWTPVPELPGMGRPVDTAVTAARRRALLRHIGRGVVVIPAAHERDLERDYVQDNDFRQDNYFYYLTELETTDAWLVMTARGPDSLATVLFLPPRVPARERWTGLRLGPDSVAVRLSGIATVLPTDSLAARLAAARQAGAPLFTVSGRAPRADQQVMDLAFAGADVRHAEPLLDSMRVVKDASELARLRTAIAITAAAERAAMQAARPGIWEYQLESVVEQTFRWNGADRVGFPSIVGSGPNSTTLHYDVNRRQTRDGDLVVVDIGAEWGQYTADVTRTFPVNGRFTPRQRAVYDLVRATQQAVFAAVRPGLRMAQLDSVARDYMRAHSGTTCGGQTCDRYFVHGFGHWLGMDVHDVGDYTMALVPGMVITDEPGIYLPAESLGVRIEDDVLVTANGAEWLSDAAPRDPAEIERLMAQGAGAAGGRARR